MNFHRYFSTLLVTVTTVGLLSATLELVAGSLKVTSATPDSGIQGETLEPVTIKGTGFLKANKVRFLVSGTNDTGGVGVTIPEVIDDETLLVNVTISGEATVAYYDIEVQLSSGRKGKGTTLFNVQSKDGSTGNDDKVGRAMICTLNEDQDLNATVMDDGDPVYENNVDDVLCISGDVVGDNFSPLRFANFPGTNPKQVQFAKRFLDLAFGSCIPTDPSDSDCNLPSKLTDAATLDTAYVHVAPYENHIHLMDPGLHGMFMRIDPRDFAQRYSIQMSNRDPDKNNNFLCYSDIPDYDITDDINVFVWEDGTYSGVGDGLPDGYTVTTGIILEVESAGNPPTVVYPDPGYAEALMCSNIGPNGERCADPKNRDDLCFIRGKVAIRFTMHMVYK